MESIVEKIAELVGVITDEEADDLSGPSEVNPRSRLLSGLGHLVSRYCVRVWTPDLSFRD